MRMQPPLSRATIDAQARAARLADAKRSFDALTAAERDIILAGHRGGSLRPTRAVAQAF